MNFLALRAGCGASRRPLSGSQPCFAGLTFGQGQRAFGPLVAGLRPAARASGPGPPAQA
eukprot:NODE_4673_length_777_cov_6.493132_g3886_i0.p1 GENE.NODE_4673_length_777_cov_6.493132_g3886_i0~~NODE_4673_length_777_cov_6.493132_g3886_i0.p1  ORF type:complete len:59 (-),score=5.63 NODE_4673_length_777_cov_6.493132_g3886_i0:463-639(-)